MDNLEQEEDALFQRAVMIVWAEMKCSTSLIQRRLEISYNHAARMIERMEGLAIISKPDHIGKRQVHSPDDLRQALQIRKEVTDIAGDEWAAILLKSLAAGLKQQPQPQKDRPMSEKAESDVTAAYTVTADELRSS